MNMWFTGSVEVVSVICLLQTIWAKPFLYNNAPIALTNLATSASASASSPAEPSSNIADLTRKQDKAQKLQAEKQLVEDDYFHFDDDVDEDRNEASPSLFQKKLNKVLAKLRFISTISNVVNGNNNKEDMDSTVPQGNPNNIDIDETFEIDTNTTEETTPLAIERQTLQKRIYPNKSYAAPLKVDLKIGSDNVADEVEDEENVEEMAASGRIGQIGVFFAEILGSIVGLAYGAAAHLNNVIQAQNAKM